MLLFGAQISIGSHQSALLRDLQLFEVGVRFDLRVCKRQLDPFASRVFARLVTEVNTRRVGRLAVSQDSFCCRTCIVPGDELDIAVAIGPGVGFGVCRVDKAARGSWVFWPRQLLNV